jgi:hypothetical protein
MTFEEVALPCAWAVLLLAGLCLVPKSKHIAKEPEGEGAEPTFLDVGGPVIDVEPA